jgi:hypothetical protein
MVKCPLLRKWYAFEPSSELDFLCWREQDDSGNSDEEIDSEFTRYDHAVSQLQMHPTSMQTGSWVLWADFWRCLFILECVVEAFPLRSLLLHPHLHRLEYFHFWMEQSAYFVNLVTLRRWDPAISGRRRYRNSKNEYIMLRFLGHIKAASLGERFSFMFLSICSLTSI